RGGRSRLGPPPFKDPQPMNRRHDLDALRAIAFSLLIVFHVGMLYVDGWDWHLKSSYTTKALDLPMIFLNRWRMDLIFLISGAATFFMMRKSSLAAFVRQRTWRLLLRFAAASSDGAAGVSSFGRGFHSSSLRSRSAGASRRRTRSSTTGTTTRPISRSFSTAGGSHPMRTCGASSCGCEKFRSLPRCLHSWRTG